MYWIEGKVQLYGLSSLRNYLIVSSCILSFSAVNPCNYLPFFHLIEFNVFSIANQYEILDKAGSFRVSSLLKPASAPYAGKGSSLVTTYGSKANKVIIIPIAFWWVNSLWLHKLPQNCAKSLLLVLHPTQDSANSSKSSSSQSTYSLNSLEINCKMLIKYWIYVKLWKFFQIQVKKNYECMKNIRWKS